MGVIVPNFFLFLERKKKCSSTAPFPAASLWLADSPPLSSVAGDAADAFAAFGAHFEVLGVPSHCHSSKKYK